MKPPKKKSSTDHLKKFKKGASGNPAGKPKGAQNRSTIARRYLDVVIQGATLPYGMEGKVTVVDAMILGLIKKAQAGDVAAFREVMDSAYGKIPDKTELTGLDGAPITTTEVKLSQKQIEAITKKLLNEY